MKLKTFFREHPLVFSLCYMCAYMVTFTLLEKFVRPKYIIHCALDDAIPFCEFFVLPYLLWFLYVPLVTLCLMHRDNEGFWRLAVMMFGGMSICLALYIIFPNGLSLRGSVPDKNIFCRIVNFIYLTDTSTNVCPSIHVLNSLACHSAYSHSPLSEGAPIKKFLSFIFVSLVCLSTVMLDQHSIIDVLCAAILFVILEKFAYRQKKAELQVHNA